MVPQIPWLLQWKLRFIWDFNFNFGVGLIVFWFTFAKSQVTLVDVAISVLFKCFDKRFVVRRRQLNLLHCARVNRVLNREWDCVVAEANFLKWCWPIDDGANWRPLDLVSYLIVIHWADLLGCQGWRQWRFNLIGAVAAEPDLGLNALPREQKTEDVLVYYILGEKFTHERVVRVVRRLRRSQTQYTICVEVRVKINLLVNEDKTYFICDIILGGCLF